MLTGIEMQKFSPKETYLIANTLSCVPFILRDYAVLIDLRNETSVAGRIDAAGTDGFMNIHLVDAVYIDRNGLQYPFEQFMVRERMIRQIHIPAYVEAESALRDWLEHGLRRRRAQPQKGKLTFKKKRAMQRHQETLQQIRQEQQSQSLQEKQ